MLLITGLWETGTSKDKRRHGCGVGVRERTKGRTLWRRRGKALPTFLTKKFRVSYTLTRHIKHPPPILILILILPLDGQEDIQDRGLLRAGWLPFSQASPRLSILFTYITTLPYLPTLVDTLSGYVYRNLSSPTSLLPPPQIRSKSWQQGSIHL